MRLPVVIQRLKDSFQQREEMYFPEGRLAFARQYCKWRWAIRLGPSVDVSVPQKLTVILLSYKRPENLQAIARSALRCSFVEKVLLCNNNPLCAMEDWVKSSDKRLVFLNN